MVDEEIWRDIPSVPQMQASSLGRVKLKPYTSIGANGRRRHYADPKPRWGIEQKSATGREGVPKRRIIYIVGLKKTFNVARLVCEAFHGPQPEGKPVVMHLDENPSNNRPGNLRWGTQKENLNMPKAREFFRARTGEKSPRTIWKNRKAA
ncbi:HNH endonuclease signature motif containing protein [Sphingobium fuliginis]|jgi:hypothetical protein|uniref:HNH endonuclease signature motif containing protein n=1 Tax=Sphingobium fuliginis (strain ATCC 27551) TaxID=336203 RepID=UPI0037CB4E92